MAYQSNGNQMYPKKKKGCCLFKILGLGCLGLVIGVVLLVVVGLFFDGGFDDPGMPGAKRIETSEVVKTTPQNSPGNPRFINVSFTQEEYRTSPAVSAKISRDETEAHFPDKGVKVHIDRYNLHNDEDMVNVQTLPVKQDPTFGHELHTYNFWMESGQDKFGTTVEVTLPIHNGLNALRNVLWHNLQSGEWEELYYTISEDGRSCTAYIDHFSEISTEEMTIDELREMGNKLVDIYGKGSVFEEYIQGDNRSTCPVGIVSTPQFASIARRSTASAKEVWEVLRQGGGVPGNAGLTESVDLFNSSVDYTSAAVTTASLLKWLPDCPSDILGTGLNVVGAIVLHLRVADMILRGVRPTKVIEENRWSWFSSTAGCLGQVASLVGERSLSTSCSCACLAVFACTTSYTIYETFVSEEAPFGQPSSIEDGAFQEYLRTPTTGALKKLGIKSDTPLTGTGQGWAEAIKAIFDENKGVLNSEQMSNRIIELYDTYINYFWEDLDPQERRNYWRAYVDRAATRWGYLDRPFIPSDQSEVNRLQEVLIKAGCIKWVERKYTASDPEGRGHFEGAPMTDEGYYAVVNDISFDSKTPQATVKDCKHRAMEALTQHTNKIIYRLLQDMFLYNILDAKRLFREEVLPLMNSTLYFYAVDKQLEKDESVNHSLYYGYNPVKEKNDSSAICKMEFSVASKTALFKANSYEAPYFCLFLHPTLHSPKLGKANVFHFLQFGAPDSVLVKPHQGSDLPTVGGKVNFKKHQGYQIPTAIEGVDERGWRVPVEFGDTVEASGLSRFDGIWIPMELKGKFKRDSWVMIFMYEKDKKRLVEFENRLELAQNDQLWYILKYYDYNEKTGVLTVDYTKNIERGLGVATFYLEGVDVLVMKNANGTFRFYRATEADFNGSYSLPV